MNLRQLIAFREVMITGSVSKAAKNLLRSQPAISSMIAGLEHELELSLFSRSRGRLVPVPEAHYLLEQSQDILRRIEDLEHNMRSARNIESGQIRLVAMPGASVFLLPDVISRFLNDRPKVSASLITHGSTQVQDIVSLQQGHIGLADLGMIAEGKSTLVNHRTITFECLCAIPVNDKLSRKYKVTPEDLSGKPLAMLYPDHPTFLQVHRSFRQANSVFNPRFEAQYFIPLLTFVERGIACSVVDPLSAESYRLYRGSDQSIVFIPFEPTVELTFTIMTPAHRPLSKLAEAFTSVLYDELVRLGA